MENVRLGWLAVLLAGTLGLSGCTGAGCTASNSTDGQVALCNNPGNFSYSTNAGMSSRTDTYTWTNSASTAKVDWSMNMGMGSASITMKDATGKQVFSKSFSGSGQQASSSTTSPGASGEWTITVKLTGASGQVAFNAHSS